MNKRTLTLTVIIAFLIAGTVIGFRLKGKQAVMPERQIKPAIGTIRTFITSTATVQPQNRLEIKPPINGRIEQILVREGEEVKAGQILAWMSSTERAALLDAARARGPEAVKHWEEVYKPTPLLSPIDGEVIVSTDEPGQTVTSSDIVIVLSDHLIVQAQVDETDIGKIKAGQLAEISLDAYPEVKVKGKVDHIYYESKVVNNVTIYQVDILPDSVPDVFRSGMSATITIMEQTKENVLTVPVDAVKRDKEGPYLLVRNGRGKASVRRIEVGLSDEKNTEIVSGADANDTVVLAEQKRLGQNASTTGTNPFMPARRQGAR